MKRKGATGIAMSFIVLIVAGFIGGNIMDSIVADSVNYDVATNESFTLSSVPETITLANTPVASGTVSITNSTGAYSLTESTNFEVLSYEEGTINIISYDDTTYGSDILVSYQYEGSQYLDNGLGRTISPYIPVMMLLALLGIVGMGVMS